jgi:type III secretory pathway lipoprotein EscJ
MKEIANSVGLDYDQVSVIDTASEDSMSSVSISNLCSSAFANVFIINFNHHQMFFRIIDTFFFFAMFLNLVITVPLT